MRIKFADSLVGCHNFGSFKIKQVTPYSFLLFVSNSNFNLNPNRNAQ